MSGTLTTEGFKSGNDYYETIFGGTSDFNSTFSMSVNLSAKTTGQVVKVEAVMNHWNSNNTDYTVAKMERWLWSYSSTTSYAEMPIGTDKGGTAATGLWSLDKTSNGTWTITKTAGTNGYTWPAEWYVKVTTSCPATKG
jgi:hypothetical protein